MKRHHCKNYIKQFTLKVIFYVTTMGWVILFQTPLLYTQQLKFCVYIKLNKREGRAGKKQKSNFQKWQRTRKQERRTMHWGWRLEGWQVQKKGRESETRGFAVEKRKAKMRTGGLRTGGLMDSMGERIEYNEQSRWRRQAGLRAIKLKKDCF